jgi:hypothetical protein
MFEITYNFLIIEIIRVVKSYIIIINITNENLFEFIEYNINQLFLKTLTPNPAPWTNTELSELILMHPGALTPSESFIFIVWITLKGPSYEVT